MSGVGEAGRGTAAVRLLAMLAVVLGLFAMHGLASTHHAAAAPGHATTATADLPLQQDRGGTHRLDHVTADDARAAAALPDGAAVGAAAPVCGEDCPSGLQVLCAAVVAAAAAMAWLLAAKARRVVLAVPAGRGPRPRGPDAARRRLTGPDPVAELCVSRT